MTDPATHLLLVDDEDSIREPLTQYLHAAPYFYEVVAARNYEEAVRAIEEKNGHFDVALVDEVLEDGPGGLDILKHIKLKYPDIEVILFTGWGLKSGEEVREIGAYGYIPKPFNLSELALMIYNAAERRRIRREREYLSTLVNVSREFTQTSDLEMQLALVWNYVREQLGMPTFFIALYDFEKDTLRFHQSYDEGKPNLLSDRFLGLNPLDWGVTGYVVKTGLEQVWSNLEQASKDWQALGISPHITGKGSSESGICLPLQVGDKTLGALSVQSYQPDAYDQVFLNAVRALGSHIAPAIVNVRLIQEITQTNDEIATAKDHLDRLISSSFDGIVSNDINGVVTGFNFRAEQILGYNVNEIIGKPVAGLYYDQQEVERISDLLRQSDDGKLIDFAANAKSKREDRIPIRLSITRLFDNQGNRIGSVGYFRDVRQIRETEMQRQRLLEASDAVAEAINLEEGLQSLSRIMAESCIVTFCSILLLTPDERSLIVKAAYPYPRSERLVWEPGINNLCMPFKEAWASELVWSNEPIVLRKGQGGYYEVSEHVAKENKLIGTIHSILIVPLQTNKKRLGVCILGEMRAWDRSPFTNKKIEIVHSLANQAATFIEKMRLHELTRQKAELLEALENLSLNISSSLELEDILARTSQVAVELFKVDHSGLVLFDPDYVKGVVVAEFPGELNTLNVDIPLRGVPIEEKLIERREPIVIYDVENEIDLGQVREIMYGQFDIHSTVFVPVISKEKLLGSFSLDVIGIKRQFTKDEINLCKIFAAHVASAIENAQLFEDANRRAEQLEALRNTTLAITSPLDRTTLLDTLVKQAVELLGAESGGIYEHSPERGALTVIADHKRPKHLGKILRVGEGMAGRLVQSDAPFLIEENYNEWSGRAPIYADGRPFGAVLEVPLKWHENIIGVLYIDDEVGRKFALADARLLRLFADQAAIALANANLVGQLNEQRDYLELILKASHTLAQAENLTDGLQSLAEMVVSRLIHAFCRILLLDESGEFLVVKASYPVPRSGGKLNWELGLDQRTAMFEWPGLDRLLQTGSPIVLKWSDEQARPVLVRFSRWLGSEEDIQSLLMVPLKIRNRVVGLLEVGETREEEQVRFTDDEIELASAIAAETTTWIDRMQLNENTERRKVELEHLHEAAKAMAGAFDIKQVLQTIVEKAKDILQADSSAIWSYDNIRDKFIPEELVAAGIPDEELQKFREEEPMPGRTAYTVMEQGWIGVTDISSPESEFMGKSTRKLLKRIGVTSFEGIALKVGDELVGVLYVNYKQPHAFGEENRRPLENLATYAALSLKRVRLLDQVSKAKKVAEVVARVTALGDREATLSSVAQGTQEAVGCDAVVLYAYDQVTDKLDHPPIMVGVRHPDRASLYGEVLPDSIVYTMLRRDEPYIVERISKDPLFKDRRFAREEEIESCVAIPLKEAGQKVGVMFVNYCSRHRFKADELTNIELFSNQAAVAIRNAQLHDETQKRAETLEGLYRAGKAVTDILTLNEILERVAEQAWRLAGGIASYTSISLVENEVVKVVAAYPPNELDQSGAIFPVIDMKTGINGRFGVAGRAAKTGVPQLVGDVSIDKDYLRSRPQTRSELAVPIKLGERTIGVINVESTELRAFGDDDEYTLTALASYAAIAINNAHLYEELKQTKGLVGSRTALAWMGMANSSWRHTIEGNAINICNTITLIRQDIQKSNFTMEQQQQLGKRFAIIESQAIKILEKPMTPPLSSEEGVETILIGDLIRERISQLREDDSFNGIAIQMQLAIPDVKVKISPDWFRRGLDILINNAVDAMLDTPIRNLTISSRLKKDQIEIAISDTGIGISNDLQEKVFKEPIVKPEGSKGFGIGLLMVQAIMQTYRGDSRLESSGVDGTTFVISIPIAPS